MLDTFIFLSFSRFGCRFLAADAASCCVRTHVAITVVCCTTFSPDVHAVAIAAEISDAGTACLDDVLEVVCTSQAW